MRNIAVITNGNGMPSANSGFRGSEDQARVLLPGQPHSWKAEPAFL